VLLLSKFSEQLACSHPSGLFAQTTTTKLNLYNLSGNEGMVSSVEIKGLRDYFRPSQLLTSPLDGKAERQKILLFILVALIFAIGRFPYLGFRARLHLSTTVRSGR